MQTVNSALPQCPVSQAHATYLSSTKSELKHGDYHWMVDGMRYQPKKFEDKKGTVYHIHPYPAPDKRRQDLRSNVHANGVSVEVRYGVGRDNMPFVTYPAHTPYAVRNQFDDHFKKSLPRTIVLVAGPYWGHISPFLVFAIRLARYCPLLRTVIVVDAEFGSRAKHFIEQHSPNSHHALSIFAYGSENATKGLGGVFDYTVEAVNRVLRQTRVSWILFDTDMLRLYTKLDALAGSASAGVIGTSCASHYMEFPPKSVIEGRVKLFIMPSFQFMERSAFETISKIGQKSRVRVVGCGPLVVPILGLETHQTSSFPIGLQAYLQSHDNIFLISGSTVESWQDSALSALLEALNNARARYILVVPAKYRGLPASIIALAVSGGAYCTEEFVDQPALLEHPHIQALITHGGYNSVCEGAELGKIIIKLPWVDNERIRSVEAFAKEKLAVTYMFPAPTSSLFESYQAEKHKQCVAPMTQAFLQYISEGSAQSHRNEALKAHERYKLLAEPAREQAFKELAASFEAF